MPLSFWIFVAIIVVVAFGLVNTWYWKNVREDFKYRQRKWAEQQAGQQQS